MKYPRFEVQSPDLYPAAAPDAAEDVVDAEPDDDAFAQERDLEPGPWPRQN